MAPLGQHVDEIDRADEVKARELLPLRLEVLGERPVAQLEGGERSHELVLAAVAQARLERVRRLRRVCHLLTEGGVDAVEALRVLWQLLADVLRPGSDKRWIR